MIASRLLSIELEAFRGFAVAREFDLNGDVVLVRGDNGTGKTSLTDGLLWLFTGTIPRLTERAKGLRKVDDPLICRYRPAGPARVTVRMRIPDDGDVTFRREGSADRSTLTAWRGDEADDPTRLLALALGLESPDQIAEAVGSWGILQQHSVLAALDAGPALHQRLADLVGLEHVTRFATAANETVKGLKNELKRTARSASELRQRHLASHERLTAARSAAAGRQPRVPQLLQTSLRELPEGLGTRELPAELEDVAALGRELTTVLEAARDVVACVERVGRAGTEAVEVVDQIEAELVALMQRAEAAVRRAPVQVQLAGAALELLGGDTCPVCRQAIDEDSVRTHLGELLQSAQADAAAAAEAQRAVADAQARLASARSAEARRTAAREDLDGALVELRSGLAEAAWLSVDRAWLPSERSAQLAGELERWQERLRRVYAEARRDAPGEVARLASDVSAIDYELEQTEGRARTFARSSRAGDGAGQGLARRRGAHHPARAKAAGAELLRGL